MDREFMKLKKNLIIKNHKLVNFINLSKNEIEIVRKWRNNRKVRKWMYNDHIISPLEHAKFIFSLKNSKNKFYWLVKKNNNSLIGVLYLTDVNWKHKRSFFGLYANPDDIRIPNKGKILVSLAIEIVFNILDFHTLKLEVLEENIKAISLYKKFGFTLEGILKDFEFKDNKWHNVLIMGKINPNH